MIIAVDELKIALNWRVLFFPLPLTSAYAICMMRPPCGCGCGRERILRCKRRRATPYSA